VRIGVRGAGLALRTTYALTKRALDLAGLVADAVTRPDVPPVDLDGEPTGPAQTTIPTPPAPDPSPPSPPPTPTPLGPPAPPPVPPEPAPPHISTEPILVAENADPGAEDGAGAEVHVAEPWEGYRQLHAADVIDRITGADTAELAAVELYELSSRKRQTVLDAVQRELDRTQAGDQ
jgi:hypothetical protein